MSPGQDRTRECGVMLRDVYSAMKSPIEAAAISAMVGKQIHRKPTTPCHLAGKVHWCMTNISTENGQACSSFSVVGPVLVVRQRAVIDSAGTPQ